MKHLLQTAHINENKFKMLHYYIYDYNIYIIFIFIGFILYAFILDILHNNIDIKV